ncbi:MAG TPA: hypothetical protein VFI82_12710 [Terriglobales bacterium]|nr:hypothetical protein [Terriglobales bacterium]
MKKSAKVTLGFVAAAAMVLLGCQRTEKQRCLDKYGMVTDDYYCDPSRPGTYRNFYHWHYGGSGGFGYGTYVHGGGTTPTPGVGHSTASGVSRGGFGGSGAAHSSGS